jgi:hypothetical protein
MSFLMFEFLGFFRNTDFSGDFFRLPEFIYGRF